ncbi:MAG: cytochrome c [Methyloprofundus sp.]|nr:cytochrome c [Methyloprofundus sp.]
MSKITTSLFLGILLPALASATEPSSARQAELKNLLKHDCGSCHGLTLKGGLGPSLLAADLAYKPDDYLIDIIQNGKKGTAMPPWKPFINPQETRWLIQTLLKAHST